MKEPPLSNCEREFLLKVVERNKRYDGRGAYDYRPFKVAFGKDYGCCHVELGNTIVMAQVSCELTAPKATRPNEGSLIVNLELSPMACPSFEAGRLSNKGVQMNRLLERCLRESKCIELESLCIIAEQQVWEVRVDIHVLNHGGNILDACSAAAIAALAHFRRPDVTVDNNKVKIHPADEKAMLPLSILHMPICTSFAFFHAGNYLLLDPTYIEERAMEGSMVVAMNKHREICALHMSGTHLLHKDQVSRCTNISAVKVIAITEMIQKALARDKEARDQGEECGLPELLCPAASADLNDQETQGEMDPGGDTDEGTEQQWQQVLKAAADGEECQETLPEVTDVSTVQQWQIQGKVSKKASKKSKTVKKVASVITAEEDESEEEAVVTLNADEM